MTLKGPAKLIKGLPSNTAMEKKIMQPLICFYCSNIEHFDSKFLEKKKKAQQHKWNAKI